MQRGPIEAPPRARSPVSPWVEISAWILAFAILLAAQCAPERPADFQPSSPPVETRR